MPKRIEALREGQVAAVSLMEPWISVAQKWGLRILIESHSTRSEAAGDDLDGADAGEDVPGAGAGGRAAGEGPDALHPLPRRARPAASSSRTSSRPGACCTPPPQPYTRERFDDTYNWTVKWNMTVPGATYENTVDNRAWE